VLLENINVNRRTRVAVPTTGSLRLRFLKTDPGGGSCQRFVIRDCGLYHNEDGGAGTPDDDVVLGSTSDSIIVSNVYVSKFSGGERELRVTPDRMGAAFDATSFGRVSLTGQTGNLSSNTLLVGSARTGGLYRVSFYLKTTTAGADGDAMKITLTWNDGSTNNQDVLPAHSLATLNNVGGKAETIRVSPNQNISFTTTLNPKAGNPQYAIEARIESLS